VKRSGVVLTDVAVPEPQAQGRVRRFLSRIGRSIKGLFTRRGIRERWHELAIGLGGTLALVPALIPHTVDKLGRSTGPNPVSIWLTVVAGLLLLVGAFRSMHVQNQREERGADIEALQLRIETLEGEDANRRAAFLETAELVLRGLAESAGAYAHHVRVSGYVHNGGGFFVQFARISKNPAFWPKGKGLYPDDEGILGAAWQRGKDACVDIDLAASPSIHETRFGMSPETVAGLRMKPRSMIALRVEDAATKSDRHVGVIVFESTQKRGVNKAMMETMLKSGQWKALELHFSSGRNYLPDTFDASKEGF
jgi:hypothetical protein